MYEYLIGNECIAIASHICATVTAKHYAYDAVCVCVCVLPVSLAPVGVGMKDVRVVAVLSL